MCIPQGLFPGESKRLLLLRTMRKLLHLRNILRVPLVGRLLKSAYRAPPSKRTLNPVPATHSPNAVSGDIPLAHARGFDSGVNRQGINCCKSRLFVKLGGWGNLGQWCWEKEKKTPKKIKAANDVCRYMLLLDHWKFVAL